MLRRISSNERGMVVVMTAFLLPVVIGLAGFAADAGFWWGKDAAAQGAADSAALAAAQSLPNASTAASVGAAYVHANYPTATTVCAHYPPQSSDAPCYYVTTPYGSTDANYRVEVYVLGREQGFLSPVFGIGNVTVKRRAVAGPTNGTSPTGLFASGTSCNAITITGPAPSGSDFSNVSLNTNGGINITGSNYHFGPANYNASCPSPVPNSHNTTFTKLKTHTDTLPFPVDYSPTSRYCSTFSSATSLAGAQSGVKCFAGNVSLNSVSGTVTIVAKCITFTGSQNVTNVSGDPLFYAYGTTCSGGNAINSSVGGTYNGDWFAPSGTIHQSSGSAWTVTGFVEAQGFNITSPAAGWVATGPGIPHIGPPALFE